MTPTVGARRPSNGGEPRRSAEDGQRGWAPLDFIEAPRIAAIAGELANGPLGPNYELVNNMNRHFDYVQRQAREALAKEREVATEKVPWERRTIHDLRRTYGTRM